MEQRIAWIITLLIVIVIVINHWINQAKRNHIVLRDSYTSVQDSMLMLNRLLDKLPPSYDGFPNYGFMNSNAFTEEDIANDSVLFINGSKIDKTTIDTVRVLSGYTPSERQMIVRLCEYLKTNDLWGAGRGGNGTALLAYDYRGSEEEDYKDGRSLIALKNLSDTERIIYGSFDQIIDRKGNLILCAPSDVDTH